MNFIDYLNPYAWLMQLRRWMYRRGILKSYSVGIPVISVGNLSMGGTGKTPFIIYLAGLLRDKKIAVVLRGYQRNSTGLLVVSDGKQILVSSGQSGDEAQLLATELPEAIVVCDENRVRGALKAKELGAEMVLLDDGFQHLRIRRDLNIILIHAKEGVPAVLPFGKGRENITAGKDADLIITTNVGTKNQVGTHEISATTTIEGVEDFSGNPINMAGNKVIALSAIGNPAVFEESLNALLVIPYRLRDHSAYDLTTLEKIVAKATEAGCHYIVTTTKDAVKIATILQMGYLPGIPIIIARSKIKILRGEEILLKSVSDVISNNK